MAEQEHDHAHEQGHALGGDHSHDEAAKTGMEKGEQTVTVEDAGPARKRLTIEIPQSRITKKIADSYVKVETEAAIPGFRRGRAPRRLVEKRFGTSIRDDVRGQLISESYTQAIEEQDLDVIGEPDVKDADTIKLPDDGPLKFSVEVEVSPKVELPPLEGIEVTKPKVDINDEAINREIELLRERYGKASPVEGGEVHARDYVQADVRILAGENANPDPAAEGVEVLAHAPNTYILVTGQEREFKGHVAGIVVNDLGTRLAGKKAGDTEVISMTGPTGHENEKIKDKPITIVIKIEKVERLEPASMETLVQQLGLESEQQLRERVTQMLESRRDRQQQSATHEQLVGSPGTELEFAL